MRKLATEGELLIVDKANARAPVHRPRADGLRRRAPRHARRRDRRRVAPARPVHDQGLHRAGVRDAGAAPQAAPRARGRGPDRGLARLQGRGRAVRHLPEGRAVRRAGRRPAPRRRRAAGARGHRPGAPARPPRAGRAQRLVHPRAPARRYDGRCWSSASASCSSARFTTDDVEAQHVLDEGDARARALPRARRRRAARARQPRARGRGRRSSRAPGTTRCATRWSSATAPLRARLLCVDLGQLLARALQGLHVAGVAAHGHRAARAAGRDGGRSSSRCSR